MALTKMSFETGIAKHRAAEGHAVLGSGILTLSILTIPD
jgi:hypothetical protein